ncbi:hypothetical protein Tco_0708401 [Tanacetum coccineum]
MSTSNAHQQSLADAGSETRPLMLKRGSYIQWASHFRRYLNRNRENRKWLNKAIDEGPYEFRIFTSSKTEAPRMQKEEDLRGDDLKHYEAEIEAMNLISISIPNDIYALLQKLCGKEAKKLEKLHDPLVLVAHTGSSSRTTTPYYVTHPSSMVDYDDEYQVDAVQNNSKDPLTSAMILLACAITQRLSNPTNNRLHTSSNTINQAIFQGTATNVQCYNYSEKGHYARNFLKPRVRDSKYFMEQMLLAKHDEAGVILTDEQNDFLFADASQMEEIEELSANICLKVRIQPANFDSDEGPSYVSAFLSEVQTPSTSYVNPLFAKDAQEQKYPKQPKIIKNTISDDQIDSNIIFDEPNGDVNSGGVEYDNNVQESYLESYKENVRVFEMNKGNNTTYFDEYIEADRKAKRFEQESQSQFIHDRDVIRDLEQQCDKLELSVVELKRQTIELQKTQSILKHKMSENQDKYHDIVLDLEARAKKNEDVVLKIGLRAISSVRRPSHRDSSFINSILTKTKNSSKKVEVSD